MKITRNYKGIIQEYEYKGKKVKYDKKISLRVNSNEYDMILEKSIKKFGKKNFSGYINYIIEKDLLED